MKVAEAGICPSSDGIGIGNRCIHANRLFRIEKSLLEIPQHHVCTGPVYVNPWVPGVEIGGLGQHSQCLRIISQCVQHPSFV